MVGVGVSFFGAVETDDMIVCVSATCVCVCVCMCTCTCVRVGCV